MATMTPSEMIQRSLGTVYVQRDATTDKPPLETLHIDTLAGHGTQLRDSHGRWVTPKSRRLGWLPTDTERHYLIVCDDDVSQETRQALIERGYRGVIERP